MSHRTGNQCVRLAVHSILAAALCAAREVAAAPPALPVPCFGGNCGTNATSFVSSGKATAT